LNFPGQTSTFTSNPATRGVTGATVAGHSARFTRKTANNFMEIEHSLRKTIFADRDIFRDNSGPSPSPDSGTLKPNRYISKR
jgi:hypothetical protein